MIANKQEIIAKIKKMANLSDTYRFFNVDFTVRSDSMEVLTTLKNMLGRFLLKENNSVNHTYYVVKEKVHLEFSALIVDDRVSLVKNKKYIAPYAYMNILNSALEKITSHIIFHAGALSMKGNGIIFPAGTGAGKSTLIMELLRRKFLFLSDDIAAISLNDNKLYPFPRSLTVYDNSINFFKGLRSSSKKTIPVVGGGKKIIFDVEDIYKSKVGDPCKGKYIVSLAEIPDKTEQAKEIFFLSLDRITDRVLEKLREIEGVSKIFVKDVEGISVIQIKSDGNKFIIPEVEKIVFESMTLIVDFSCGVTKIKHTDVTPELKPISKSEMIRFLISQFKGDYGADILNDRYGGSLTKFYMGIGDIIKDMECFRLMPGNFKKRADLICGLVNADN